ncbi:MerR family DNA-binding transcriptional regulator, partial [Corynebacterium tuscaniense]|uniref:MerR family transcriptional regulator n=2 Tax=Corynebacteriaceae TaxID=1653 RepID=UPI00123C27E9
MVDGIEYTIGEAAEALGVSTKALRHWEALGLITPARTWAEHRRNVLVGAPDDHTRAHVGRT